MKSKLNRVAYRVAISSMTVVPVAHLPKWLVTLLKRNKYTKRDIKIKFADKFTPLNGGSGSRGVFIVCQLSDGRILDYETGDWGGSSWHAGGNRVDDHKPIALPPRSVAIMILYGANYGMLCVRQSDFDLLTPAHNDVGDVGLTKDETSALLILNSIKSGYRQDEFLRKNLGDYNQANPIIKSLARQGLVKIMANGMAITSTGKAVAAKSRGW